MPAPDPVPRTPTAPATGSGRDPVKVLWLAKGLGRGGTERILASSVRHLDRDRFDVEVAYLLPWKDALVAELEDAGITVHCLDGANRRVLTWPLRLRSLVEARGYAIVHTHMPYPAAAARIVLRRRSGPVLVHTEHNVWDRFRPVTREANSLTLSRNAAVIAVSGAVARSITRPALVPWAAQPRIDVIHHGIDGERVRAGAESRSAARASLELGVGEFVVGTVGNLTAKKDHRTMLEAIARVARGASVRAVIVGDGPLRQDLEATAAALGIDDRVVFLGTRADVPAVLPAFDAFVLSSRFEGFPIALVEAMAAGLPCVATRAGGTPELVEHRRNGLLVPPGAPAVLARAIEELIADPELRRSLGAQAARDSARFSLRQAVERLQDIYADVVARR